MKRHDAKQCVGKCAWGNALRRRPPMSWYDMPVKCRTEYRQECPRGVS